MEKPDDNFIPKNKGNIKIDENILFSIVSHCILKGIDKSNQFHIENKEYNIGHLINEMNDWAIDFINKEGDR